MYTCPHNTKHTKFHSVIMKDSIHHAKIVCSQCEAFIKWASPTEISNLNMGEVTSADSIICHTEPKLCPFKTTKPMPASVACRQDRCQLWWLCDSEGVLAKVLTISWGDHDDS